MLFGVVLSGFPKSGGGYMINVRKLYELYAFFGVGSTYVIVFVLVLLGGFWVWAFWGQMA